MITILVDHDIEGQALTLWGMLAAEGWLTLLPLQLVTFAQIGLPADSSDRAAWHTAQARGMVLLTHNRNMKGDDSLEQTIREDNTPTALPGIPVLSRPFRLVPLYPVVRNPQAQLSPPALSPGGRVKRG